jgi:hypothetical protein
MIGHVIAGQRGNVFLVSKVVPDHATASGIRQACARYHTLPDTDRHTLSEP